MKIRVSKAFQVCVAAAALAGAGQAQAQGAYSWYVKIGGNKITPHVESADVSPPALPNTKADVGTDAQPIFNIGYLITDHVSAELDLGTPYKHDFIGAGAIAGAGTIGTAEVLPPTAFIQYRFLDPGAPVRPYVGLGLTYAYFQKETGSGRLTAIADTGGPATSFRLDNKFAASFQLGATVAVSPRWFVDAALILTRLKTRATYSTGQTQDIRLDPRSVSISVGYRF